MSIILKNVWFTYDGSRYVLKDISVKISEGEYVAIMGDNGSGKTTFLKHLNGLLRPSKGMVLIDGLNTVKTSTSELAREVAVVFQSPEQMFFSENVFTEIAFALRNFGLNEREVKREVERVLSIFDLKKYSTRSPFNLSEGEKRRLAFACILAWGPKYIILDEPTAGQDIVQRELLKELIKQLVSQKRTVVIASHDVEFVAETKPLVYLLANGEIIGHGRTKEVLFDEMLVKRAGLILPQMAETFKLLDEKISKRRIVCIEDALRFILEKQRNA